jgi:hypothetical protein
MSGRAGGFGGKVEKIDNFKAKDLRFEVEVHWR